LPRRWKALAIDPAPTLVTVLFITLEEYLRAIEQRVKAVDWNGLAEQAVRYGLERKQGRV
jgi:hypothetical protein